MRCWGEKEKNRAWPTLRGCYALHKPMVREKEAGCLTVRCSLVRERGHTVVNIGEHSLQVDNSIVHT